MKGLIIVILIVFYAWSSMIFNLRTSDIYQYYHSYKLLNEYEKELKDEYTEVVEGIITDYDSVETERYVDRDYFIRYAFQVKDETYEFDSIIRYENSDVTKPFLVYYKKYFPEKHYTSEDIIKAKENTETIMPVVGNIISSLGLSIIIGSFLYSLFGDFKGEKNKKIFNGILVFSYILMVLGLFF